MQVHETRPDVLFIAFEFLYFSYDKFTSKNVCAKWHFKARSQTDIYSTTKETQQYINAYNWQMNFFCNSLIRKIVLKSYSWCSGSHFTLPWFCCFSPKVMINWYANFRLWTPWLNFSKMFAVIWISCLFKRKRPH